MKRTLSLIVLLGLVMGAVVTGCDNSGTGDVPASTNAAPAAATTNAP